MKKFHKDIQPHFSLSCQDPTLFQFSSKLWQLISTFQDCLSISRASSHYPIYSLKMSSSAPLNSTVINMLIVKIHIFNTNLILTSQSIVLKPLHDWDLKINMFQIYYLYSLPHSQIMLALLCSLSQSMVSVFSFSVNGTPLSTYSLPSTKHCHASQERGWNPKIPHCHSLWSLEISEAQLLCMFHKLFLKAIP